MLILNTSKELLMNNNKNKTVDFMFLLGKARNLEHQQ